jgi:hypothetical protein
MLGTLHVTREVLQSGTSSLSNGGHLWVKRRSARKKRPATTDKIIIITTTTTIIIMVIGFFILKYIFQRAATANTRLSAVYIP